MFSFKYLFYLFSQIVKTIQKLIDIKFTQIKYKCIIQCYINQNLFHLFLQITDKKTKVKTKYYQFQGCKCHGYLEGQVIYNNDEKLASFNGQISKTDKKGNIINGNGMLEYKSKIYTNVYIEGQIQDNYLVQNGAIVFNKQIKIQGEFTKQQQINLMDKIHISQENIFNQDIVEGKTVFMNQTQFVVEEIGNIIKGKIICDQFIYEGSFQSVAPYQFMGIGTATQKSTGLTIKCLNWNNGMKDGETTVTYSQPTSENIIQQISIYKENILQKVIQITYVDKKITYNDDGTVKLEKQNDPGYYIGKDLDNLKLNGIFNYYHEDVIEKNLYKQDVLIQKLTYEDTEKQITLNNDNAFIKYKLIEQTYDGQVNSQNQPDGQGILTINDTQYDGTFKNGNKCGNFLIIGKQQIRQEKYKNDILVQHFWKYDIEEKTYTRYDKNRIIYVFQGYIDQDYLPDGEGILIQNDKQYECIMESGSLVSKRFIGHVQDSKLSQNVTYNPTASTLQPLNSESDNVVIKEISLANSKSVKTKLSASSSIKSSLKDSKQGSNQSSVLFQNASTERQRSSFLPLIAIQQQVEETTTSKSQQTGNDSLIISQIDQSVNDIISQQNSIYKLEQSRSDAQAMIDNGDTITYFDNINYGRIVDKQNRNLIYKGNLNASGEAYGQGIMFFDDNTFIQAIFQDNDIVKVLHQGKIQ